MSPPGVVMTRPGELATGARGVGCTRRAATSKSSAFVVETGPQLLVMPLVSFPTRHVNGLVVSIPLYSAIRRSGVVAEALNVTVTVFAPAAAVRMFLA